MSIASSGPRCGVYVLVSLDTKLQNATNQLAKDLEPNTMNLVWKDGKFIWKDSPFEQYPLRLDVPPDDTEFNRIVKIAGEAAKQAKRVEVPFDGHRSRRPTSTGPGTAGASSTSRSAAPVPPSSRTSSSAKGRRNTS